MRKPRHRRLRLHKPLRPPPPPTPIPFDDALLRAANDLFSKATVPAGSDKVELVIDPLIDAATGAQSAATRLMQERIKDLVAKSYPRFAVLPFSSDALSRAPVVLIGTFTAINNAGAPDGVRDAYRICLALADLRSKSIVSKGVARANPMASKPTRRRHLLTLRSGAMIRRLPSTSRPARARSRATRSIPSMSRGSPRRHL